MKPEELTPAERAFLLGLEKLTRETGIKIGGCGCCNSPYLEPITPEEQHDPRGGYMMHDRGYMLHDHCQWISASAPEYGEEWYEYHRFVVKEEGEED